MTARRTAAVRLSPTVPVWLLFLSLAGASVLWSVNPDATVSDFVILASLILLYVFVSLSHVDRVVLRRTENGLLLGGVIVTCWGLAQLFLLGGFPDDTAAVGPAPDGRFGNDLVGPDNLPVALLLPLVVALSRAVTLTGRPQRFLHALIALLILGGILMTGSRGGILAALVAAVTLAFVIPRSARASLLAYGAVGLAVAALVWIYHPWGVAEREVETTSSSGRTDIWQVGLAACPRYCPVGSGWG
ncbi:MAG: O-antigen ligase family protein, partial [Nocardioidaceae bacterium]|nr:O-antigen ligase family protein [Nocardioidaceae bacterium]